MRPSDEYIGRHALTVPLVPHSGAGSLVLRTPDRSKWTNRWLLVTSEWEPHPRQPGQYKVVTATPVHDGYRSSNHFQSTSVRLKWHEYEGFMINWASDLKGSEPVGPGEDCLLALWEIFALTYDSWLAARIGEFGDSFFRSLDPTLPKADRVAAQEKTYGRIAERHPDVARFWKSDFLSRTQNYAEWFARLIRPASRAR